jgi:hypothetical protein
MEQEALKLIDAVHGAEAPGRGDNGNRGLRQANAS